MKGSYTEQLTHTGRKNVNFIWFLNDVVFTKGQIKSEWIYEVIDFPNQQLKNLKDFCPESFEVEYL